MEILLSFAAGIYCFLWNRQPRSNILLAGKMSCVHPPWIRKHAGREGSLTVTHGDDSSAGNCRASPVPAGSSTPMKNHRCHTGWKRPQISAKQLVNIMICICEAAHFERHGRPNKGTLSAVYKGVVTPVEKHAPTNELISDMNCGVYVWVFRCRAHSLPSLLWPWFKRETAYCTCTNWLCSTETTLWDLIIRQMWWTWTERLKSLTSLVSKCHKTAQWAINTDRINDVSAHVCNATRQNQRLIEHVLPGCKRGIISHTKLLLQFKEILMKLFRYPDHISFTLDLVFAVWVTWSPFGESIVMITITYLWLSQHIRYDHKLYSFLKVYVREATTHKGNLTFSFWVKQYGDIPWDWCACSRFAVLLRGPGWVSLYNLWLYKDIRKDWFMAELDQIGGWGDKIDLHNNCNIYL